MGLQMRRMGKCIPTLATVIVLLVSSVGCAGKPATEIETYPVAGRQVAPEPVYSRVTWSQLPQPIPPKAVTRDSRGKYDNVPLFRPVIKVELERSTLGEAIQALAQTIGYESSYPKALAGKKVRLNTVGTIEDSLKEIERQAGVKTELDHDQRVVRVIDKLTEPRLPR